MVELIEGYDAVGGTFIRAASNIRERGLYKGYYQAPDGKCICAFGAINLALTGTPFYSEGNWTGEVSKIEVQCRRELEAYLRPKGFHNVIDWNDGRYCTSEEVIETFNLLAEKHKLVTA